MTFINEPLWTEIATFRELNVLILARTGRAALQHWIVPRFCFIIARLSIVHRNG
jgi:hypothetical protein